jgi:hypothetical protein
MAGKGRTGGARRATRTPAALALGLLVLGVFGSAALAARRPAISWSISATRIDAGARPLATFTVHLPRGDRSVLQKQVGSRHVWTSLAALHPGHGGRGSVSAPRLAQGAHLYRIAVVDRRRRIVLRSHAIQVLAYADVALATVTGRGTQVFDVNGQPFTYDVGVFATEASSGVADSPAYDKLVAMPRATCRSIGLRLAAPVPDAGESGGTVAVSIVQENADPATIQLTGNQIASFSAQLTGAAWELHASSLVPATGPGGASNELDIAADGSLSCYTPSGR